MSQVSPAIYGKLLFTALVWGASWIAGRVAVLEASPFAVASWRFFIAALVLGFILVRREGLPRWSARQWLMLSALGLSGIFMYNIFFLYGLRLIEAGRGALVVALTPAVIALTDWLIYRAPMSTKKALGVGVALLGCLLVVTRGQPSHLLTGDVGFGECLIIGSVFSWVIYTFISRHIGKHFTPLSMTFGGCLTGWAFLTLAALLDGTLFVFSETTWRGYSSIAFLGVMATAIGFTWYSEAIGKIGTTLAAAFINLVPVFAVLLGALLLDERLGGAVLAGGACVIAGVWITNRFK